MNLTELYQDERYFETIVRATGLISQEKRIARILDIANYNIHLACTCKITSLNDEEEVVKHLVHKCREDIRYYKKFEKSLIGIISLSVLGEYDEITRILTKMNLYEKIQTRVLRKTIEELDTDTIFIILRKVLEKSENDSLPKYMISLLLRKNEYRLPQDLDLVNKVTDFLLSSSNIDYLNLAFKWINKYSIKKVTKESIIAKMVKRLSLAHLSRIDYVYELVINNNFETRFSKKFEKIFASLLQSNNLKTKKFAKYLIHKHNLINPNITVGKSYSCEVTHVIPSRVFVEIIGHPTTSSSIYIGEISDKKIADLNLLYSKGDKIIAKVLSVDRIKGVNLTVKNQ